MKHLLDMLIIAVVVLVISILVNIAVYDQPYSCFDSTVRPGRGDFIEVTNCVYDDYWSEYTCDQGVYKYCNEGALNRDSEPAQEDIPAWDFQTYEGVHS